MNTNTNSTEHFIEMRKMLEEKKLFFKHRKNNTLILEKIENLLIFINCKLMADCKHEYENDYIDINPDKSQQICYCKICWCTFPIK